MPWDPGHCTELEEDSRSPWRRNERQDQDERQIACCLDMEIAHNLTILCAVCSKAPSPLTSDSRRKSFKQAFSRMLTYWGRRRVLVSCRMITAPVAKKKNIAVYFERSLLLSQCSTQPCVLLGFCNYCFHN